MLLIISARGTTDFTRVVTAVLDALFPCQNMGQSSAWRPLTKGRIPKVTKCLERLSRDN